jgi:primosomal protein N' (replication factor Y)
MPGVRVSVQVGKKKLYTALIHHIHQEKPSGYEVKNILSVLDTHALVNDFQLRLWEWIAGYYMCTLGEVYRAALPSGFKLNTFKPRLAGYLRLNKQWLESAKLNGLLDSLSKAPRQFDLLTCYIEASGYTDNHQPGWIEKTYLLKKTPNAAVALKSLVKKGILDSSQQEISRLTIPDAKIQESLLLNENQRNAFREIKQHFQEKEVVLLHGVTSSGKTEIYIQLIREELAKGKQVLYLLPEIALTTQIVSRLRAVFGDYVGVYHSRFSDNERLEIWKNLNDQLTENSRSYRIILGARSSVFLPFADLGLVIVDEEHENTYKQFDPAPRYHARDTAILLAHLHRAKVLLGSATPSLESYYNCITAKYGLVELSSRYLDIQLPEIRVVNIREAYRKKQMKSHFSILLLEAIEKSLQQQEQVILFQNRRGFSLYLACAECGWVPRCIHCDVSLTYHKTKKELVCHYCGYSVSTATSCKDCGSHNLQMKGFGTEKIEDEIQLFFPGIHVARLDIDAARSRKSYEKIISGFERGDTDILVGTQMVSKGLDFDNVSLVGILNADNMLNYPDFRAYERSFQLMMQVSGRAGRKNKRGLVIIQAYDSANVLFDPLITNDFKSYARRQLMDRNSFLYPPYTRLIEIIIKHKQKEVMDMAGDHLTGALKKQLGVRVMGPEYPVISRIRNHYLKRILLKIEKEKSIVEVKEFVIKCIEETKMHDDYKSLIISVDVDPA